MPDPVCDIIGYHTALIHQDYKVSVISANSTDSIICLSVGWMASPIVEACPDELFEIALAVRRECLCR